MFLANKMKSGKSEESDGMESNDNMVKQVRIYGLNGRD